MLVHTRKKDFQCEICENKFSRKQDLQRHMQDIYHTKIKAHECDICKKKFSQKGNLVQHFRIYLGEKPCGCAECEKWFTQCSNRNRHIRTCHKKLTELVKNNRN